MSYEGKCQQYNRTLKIPTFSLYAGVSNYIVICINIIKASIYRFQIYTIFFKITFLWYLHYITFGI